MVFCPAVPDMYPDGTSIAVTENALSRTLCGASRPGHFDGVCTIVAKLFNVVLPHIAVLGENDAQQLRVLRRMVRNLLFPVDILPGPTVRESDGLAMSSRNQYLTPEQRPQAICLRRALDETERLVHRWRTKPRHLDDRHAYLHRTLPRSQNRLRLDCR